MTNKKTAGYAVFSVIASMFFLPLQKIEQACWAEGRMLSLVRLSALRNVPVILGERQIGLFQHACLDKAQKRVGALIVSGGMRGKRIVPAAHVRVLTKEFILIDGWTKHRQGNKQNDPSFVRDNTGLLVGRVADYAIDEKTLEVLAFELMLGYLPAQRRGKIWMFTYDVSGTDLSVPIILYSEPSFSREGNEACGCPP